MITIYNNPVSIECNDIIREYIEEKSRDQIKTLFINLDMISKMFFYHLFFLEDRYIYKSITNYRFTSLYLLANYKEYYTEYIEYVKELNQICFYNNQFNYIKEVIYNDVFQYELGDGTLIDCCKYNSGFVDISDAVNKFILHYINIKDDVTFALIAIYFTQDKNIHVKNKPLREGLRTKKHLLIELNNMEDYSKYLYYGLYDIFEHNFLTFFKYDYKIIQRNNILNDLLEED